MNLFDLPLELQSIIYSEPGVVESLSTTSKKVREFLLQPDLLRLLGRSPFSYQEVLRDIQILDDRTQENILCDNITLVKIRPDPTDVNVLCDRIRFYLDDESDDYFAYHHTDRIVGNSIDIDNNGSLIFGDDNYLTKEDEQTAFARLLYKYLSKGYSCTNPITLYSYFQRRLWLNFNYAGYSIRRTAEIMSSWFTELEDLARRYSKYQNFLRFSLVLLEDIDSFEDTFEDRLREKIAKEEGKEGKEEGKEEGKNGKEEGKGEVDLSEDSDSWISDEPCIRTFIDDKYLPLAAELFREYVGEYLRRLPRRLVEY